jgi:hypothetical protein
MRVADTTTYVHVCEDNLTSNIRLRVCLQTLAWSESVLSSKVMCRIAKTTQGKEQIRKHGHHQVFPINTNPNPASTFEERLHFIATCVCSSESCISTIKTASLYIALSLGLFLHLTLSEYVPVPYLCLRTYLVVSRI